MTAPGQESQVQEQPNQKEMNFRALESRYQQALDQERNARLEAERKASEYEQKARSTRHEEEEEDDTDPYVDKKKLTKTLQKFGEQSKQETQSEIQKAVNMALKEERKANWLKQNSDYDEVMSYAEKFERHDPDLAETILQMPPGFERMQLVYKNIKALGLHKPPEQKSAIQDKINANQRSPMYQPSSVGTSPYTPQGDFSKQGQANAYQKMQELKSRLRLS